MLVNVVLGRALRPTVKLVVAAIQRFCKGERLKPLVISLRMYGQVRKADPTTASSLPNHIYCILLYFMNGTRFHFLKKQHYGNCSQEITQIGILVQQSDLSLSLGHKLASGPPALALKGAKVASCISHDKSVL